MAETACLDLVGLVGRDIGAMTAAYRRLGFAPTPPQPLLGRDPVTGVAVSLQQTSAHLADIFTKQSQEYSAKALQMAGGGAK